ncbi:S8 family serine peptidase [Mesonia aestuariivivens]|uniref:S8 family serine peptidase n=1 Tax=Mesonia aestuariivivens TaxID=2796128 RepID=A0ABS6W560_9FLAO|nr:S8 family serine peptidase [Mesonia aestuariivivens]MBW2962854.1 S8 family serine peptidase [Mesonia aestuariivivens]
MKVFLLLFIICCNIGFSQEHAWVYFTDKPNASVALSNPNSILTQRAINRKNAHNIVIDERDVPVNEAYLSALKNQNGILVKAKSKWLNCVHVIGDFNSIDNLTQLNFVEEVLFTNTSLNARNSSFHSSKVNLKNHENLVDFEYGNSANQIEMIHANYLYQNDFTGENMLVAIMDAGFPNVNIMTSFSRLRDNNNLMGGYDFVDREENYDDATESNHGTKVLSDMAGFIQNEFVGTAPDASYYLFRTEDASSETPVEESYWVEAAERADSLGVDVINTSLGYFNYDNPNYNYTPADMDGNTAFITRGANIAVEKGILVVTSAGNSGNNQSFPVIAAPADGNVYTVGAVNPNEEYASFSSIGPTADGRIKPDGVAQGSSAAVINQFDQIVYNNGTSFSAPIMAGAITSFWQANPQLTNLEIMQKVRESSSRFNNPNEQLGYGIPNFQIALDDVLDSINYQEQSLKVHPNPVKNILKIEHENLKELEIKIYNMLGKLVLEAKNTSSRINLSKLSSGIYIAKFTSVHFQKSIKIIKE